MTLKIEMRQIDELVPDPKNARLHSDRQIDKIAASMIEFGWTNPILHDDMVRAGHGRLVAAQLIYDRGDRINAPNGKGIIYLTPYII